MIWASRAGNRGRKRVTEAGSSLRIEDIKAGAVSP